jgi:hypothetical protein
MLRIELDAVCPQDTEAQSSRPTPSADSVRGQGVAREARVTIVVPTYRRPDYLAQCLSSIRAQTYTDYVVTVCDNSPDQEGRPVVEGLADGRFVYISRPRNLGLFGNAVRGLADAETEFVMEVDDDDRLLPECLASLVPALDDQARASIAFGDIHVIDAAGRRMPPDLASRYIAPRADLPIGFIRPFLRYAASGSVFLNAGIMRHDAVDWAKIPEEAGAAYDRHVALELARGNRAAYRIARPIMEYRVHASADTWRHLSDQHRAALHVLLTAQQQLQRRDGRRWVDAEVLRTRLFLARSLLESGERGAAAHEVARGLGRSETPAALLSLIRIYGGEHSRRAVGKVGARVAGRLRPRDRLQGRDHGFVAAMGEEPPPGKVPESVGSAGMDHSQEHAR